MTEEEIQDDKTIITEADLASALDGNFLDKMSEFAWRGKEAKIPETPNEEILSFHIILGFTFNAESTNQILTFDKLSAYRFQCSPSTIEDIRKSNENRGEIE